MSDLDAELRRALGSAFRDDTPETPAVLPAPRSRSLAPTMAGALGVGLVLVVGAAAFAFEQAESTHELRPNRATVTSGSQPPASPLATAGVTQACETQDGRLSVNVTPTKVIDNAGRQDSTLDVSVLLEATSGKVCRLGYQDFTGSISTSSGSDIYDVNCPGAESTAGPQPVAQLTASPQRPQPLPETPQCFGSYAVAKSGPSAVFPANPNVSAAGDHGILFAANGTVASSGDTQEGDLVSLAHEGKAGSPEPVFRSVTVAMTRSGALAAGRFTVKVGYGTWTASEVVTIK